MDIPTTISAIPSIILKKTKTMSQKRQSEQD
jgi:hypothetical protein